MKKQYLLLTFLLFISSSFVYSQIPVLPGEGTLHTALSTANDGDVFLLIPGAEYTESVEHEFATIDKTITIQMDGEPSSPKPILRMLTSTAEGVTLFFFIADGGSLTLNGLEFDGNLNSVPSVSYLLRYFLGDIPSSTNVGTTKIINCYVHDLINNVLDGMNSSMTGLVLHDSLIVDNSVFFNTSTIAQCKYTAINFMSFTNSTFNHIISYGLRIMGPSSNGFSNSPTVFMNYCTMNDVGGDKREFIRAEELQNYWTITNCIFSNLTNQESKGLYWKNCLNDSVATVSNCDIWLDGVRDWKNNLFIDNIEVDPAYADAANNDLTLPENSPLFTAGTDGGPIGDPRWNANAQTGVEDYQPVLKEFALAQNYPNPFNPSTTIIFNLEKNTTAELAVYDVLGKEVAVLINEYLPAGQYTYKFNAADIPSGIYIYKLSAENKSLSQKMLLLK